jgi:hypothetical protein
MFNICLIGSLNLSVICSIIHHSQSVSSLLSHHFNMFSLFADPFRFRRPLYSYGYRYEYDPFSYARVTDFFDRYLDAFERVLFADLDLDSNQQCPSSTGPPGHGWAISQSVAPLKWAVSVHQQSQDYRTDDHFFWDQDMCIVCDAYWPISSTGICEIKRLSTILIHIIFIIFMFPLLNMRFFQGEVIPATKWPRIGDSDRDRSFLLAISLWELYRTLCHLWRKSHILCFSHIQGRHLFASTLSDFLLFLLIGPGGLHNRLIIPVSIIFTVTL